ncbi:MAG: FG-GAP repeat domain-containing protein [Acidimicrobiia bacterium]
MSCTGRPHQSARWARAVMILAAVGASGAIAAVDGGVARAADPRASEPSACASSAKHPLSVGYRAATGPHAGPLQFQDATQPWGALDPLTGMMAHAIATADVNGDGWTDVFVGTFADRPVAD